MENEKNTDTQTESVPPVFNVQQCIDTKTGASTRVCNKREAMPPTESTLQPITSSLNAYTHTFQPANHSNLAQPKQLKFVSDGFSYIFE